MEAKQPTQEQGKMTEQLREKIAKEVGQHTENCPWEVCSKSEQDAAYRSADFILALIKEAGYVKSDRGIWSNCDKTEDECLDEWAKANGYVRLADLTREQRYAIWKEVELEGK